MPRLKSFLTRRIKSFAYAFNGLKYILRTQTNFIIHLVATVIVVSLGFVLNISQAEWLAVVFSVTLVLFAEAINTAIEKICDYVSPDFNKKIGLIKDIAAAGVLITALGAIVTGLIIFLPKTLQLF